jgi:hypothetical protein
MRSYFKIPLVFLLLAALAGVLLRWNYTQPIGCMNPLNWIHAHSHVMFLGWLTNSFVLAFVYKVCPERWNKVVKWIFMFLQLLIAGMCVSFPLQGYGAASIILSALHTFTIALLVALIWPRAGKKDHPSTQYVKWALIFFLISSVGPFSLGPIMANDLGHTKWYYFAIYFYLHFQYNGFFLLAAIALVIFILDRYQITSAGFQKARTCLILSIFPTYLLSVLRADVPIAMNWISLAGMLLQCYSACLLVAPLAEVKKSDWQKVSHVSRMLLSFAMVAFITKNVLQLLSAHPIIAQLAYDNRPYVIAYLHLVLIGVITFVLLAWYVEEGIISKEVQMPGAFLLFGFILSELILVTSNTFKSVADNLPLLLLSFSMVLFLGMFLFVWRGLVKPKQ